MVALTQSAIADVMSPRERGRYQGYISAVWAIASVSGPLVGGFVAQSFSWRWIFLINAPVGAAAMWACHNGLRRFKSPLLSHRPKLDIVGMLLLAGALSVLLLALAWGGSIYAWTSHQILRLVSLGVSLLLLLIVQELRVSDPLLPPRVFASASYVTNVIVSTLTSLLLFMCLFTIPLYFQLARGATPAQSGIYVAPFMLASAVGNLAGSRWAGRVGTLRGGLRMSSAFCCAGLILLALLPLNAPVWTVIAAMIITGPGVGGCLIGSIMSAQNALVAQDIGSGTGALLVLRSVGGACGSTLAGTIIAAGLTAVQQTTRGTAAPTADLGWRFGTVYAIAAAFAAISFLVTLRMPNARLRETAHLVPIAD